jgi:hypothetical protein
MYLIKEDLNTYRARFIWEIDHDSTIEVDDASPKDAVSIRFSDSSWQPVDASQNGIELWSDYSTQSYKNYKRYGVLAENDTDACDGCAEEVPRMRGMLETRLERLDNANPVNVYGEYVHVYGKYGTPSWFSSISLGPAGIDVSGWGIGDWRIEETVKPDY